MYILVLGRAKTAEKQPKAILLSVNFEGAIKIVAK